MTYHDYITGKDLYVNGVSFAALIQAAMRTADYDNSTKLRLVFPEIYEDLYSRYHAPSGILSGDK